MAYKQNIAEKGSFVICPIWKKNVHSLVFPSQLAKD